MAPALLELDWEDDDAEKKLLTVVESDPTLGARIIATANSVGYAAPGARYTTIVSAVRRLGLRRSIHLATSLLFAQPMGHRLPAELNRALWLHALMLATAAQELARLKYLPEPNAAYLLGLVHDIGYLAMEYLQPGILGRVAAEATAANLSQEQAEFRMFGAEHHDVAAQLLALWGVPADLVAPVRTHHDIDFEPDSMAAILYGAEKMVRCSDVVEVMYAGLDHPFAPMAIDRNGIEFLFQQQLELGSDAVDTMAARITEQVGSLREAAVAMTA